MIDWEALYSSFLLAVLLLSVVLVGWGIVAVLVWAVMYFAKRVGE